MAVADKTMVVDGQTYYPGDTIPDLGSIVCVEAVGNKRDYEGLLSDVSKLPHYVETGSSALLFDGNGNTELYEFHKPTDKWYKL